MKKLITMTDALAKIGIKILDENDGLLTLDVPAMFVFVPDDGPKFWIQMLVNDNDEKDPEGDNVATIEIFDSPEEVVSWFRGYLKERVS